MMSKVLGLLSKLALFVLKHPVNFLCGGAFVFFAAKYFVFNGGTTDQLMMFAVAGVWFCWFLATHILLLVLVIMLLGGAGYIYYTNLQRQKAECEQSGGEWNSDLHICEEKKTLMQKAGKFVSGISEKAQTFWKIFANTDQQAAQTQEDKKE